MAGLRNFWIICTLMMFAACVPKTKQTECGSNEAFNASLRTCVPIVGGPTSFINITSFAPVSSITKYKNDTTSMTFEVTVSNPYNQSYSLSWERNFNGNSVSMCSNAPSCSFSPSLLGTALGEVGTHVLVAKVKDSNGTTVDSHNFEIRIVDLPKPIINSASLNPPTSTLASVTPLSGRIQFDFTISNNGAALNAGMNYRTVWTVTKNGALIYTEPDPFTDFTTTGSNIAYLGTSPTPYFNPATLGVGSYVIRAKVQNDVPGETVAEQQWNLIIEHPPLSPITARPLYASGAGPSFNTTVRAYNGIAYNAPAGVPYNFIPVGSSTQSDFCVNVQNGDGSYPGDGLFVRVDFYLDGVTLVYQNSTTAIDGQVCLTDGGAGALSSVLFNNTTTTASQPHTLVARVYDEFLGTEYSSTNLNTGQGTYPITWNFDVKPQNAAPVVSFGTSVACTTTTASTKTGCAVTSDTNFTVGINFISDDFYSVAANEGSLNYSLRLYKNGTVIQTCDKTDAGYTGTTDTAGPEYTCVFNVESYDATGPINVTAQTYEIRGEISDTGSPLTGSGATSTSLVWQLLLTEGNSAPTIAAFSSNPTVNEGSTLPFTLSVNDVNRDNFSYQLFSCKDDATADPTCSNTSVVASGTVTRTSNALMNTVNLNLALSEDFLLNYPLIPCDTIARNAACPVRFKATVKDIPDTVDPKSVTTSIITVNITNINPAPVFNELLASPVPVAGIPYNGNAFVGIPFTISAAASGVVTDSSAPASEKMIRYQWYARNEFTSTSWVQIDSATSPSLVWTPSLIREINLASDNPVRIMLCVEDQSSSVVPTPVIGTSVCNDANPWRLVVKNNIATLEDLPTSLPFGADTPKDMAVWYDLPSLFNGVSSTAVYVAAVDSSNNIYVKKALLDNSGNIIPDSATRLVTLQGFPDVAASDVQDLSLTGTSGNSLYIAYRASKGGAPGTYFPQLRRIDISNRKIAPNNHQGGFGFDYDGILIDKSNVTTGKDDIFIANIASAGSAPTVTFAPTTTNIGEPTQVLRITTPLGFFNIPFEPFPNSAGTICNNCDGPTMAANLATAINMNYTNLMGITADASATNTTTIFGSLDRDFLDLSDNSLSYNRNTDQLGQIYIEGGNFYLPFIDNSLGGSYNDKISFLAGTVDVHLQTSSAASVIDAFVDPDLNNLPPSIKISTSKIGSDLYLALVTKTGNSGKIFKVNAGDFSPIADVSIMSGDLLTDIEISASTSRVFVKAHTASDIKLGAYSTVPAVIAGSERFLSDPALIPDATARNIFNSSNLSSLRIVAYGNEARLIGASDGDVPSEYRLYGAKFFTNGTWTLQCAEDCERISPLDQEVSPKVKIAVAPLRTKIAADPLYKLSSDGAVTNQSIRDVLFIGLGLINSAGTDCHPNLGVINVENEVIGATTLHSGTNPNEDSGLFRLPFFKN